MSACDRVVITGTGAVCGAGLDVEEIWESLVQGRSAVKEITSWPSSGWPAAMAAEVTGVDNRTLVEDRKLHKLISRTDMFGLYAADSALRTSGLLAHRQTLDPDTVSTFNDRSGIFAGSGGGNYRSNYDFFRLMASAGGDVQKFGRELGENVNPMWLLRILPNNVVCHVGIRHSLKGTNACITNHCAGGALAVAEAFEALSAGEADRAVAIGHDTPLEPETVLHYHRLGLESTEAPRSFDQNRQGMVFGEGAAAVVLEKYTDAKARSAPLLGEFLGSGCSCEASGVFDLRPDGDGLSRAIEIALSDAGICASEVGMVVAHGNGTRASDSSEVQALRRVFGSDLPPVTAFKWAFGHLIAASGTLDLVLALAALRNQVVPGIATLQRVDPEFGDFPVSAFHQKPRANIALVLCRGFGGMNVANLVRTATT